MKKLFILGLISLSINAQGPLDQGAKSSEGFGDAYRKKHGSDYNPDAAREQEAIQEAIIAQQIKEEEKKQAIARINQKKAKESSEFTKILELYKAIFKDDFSGWYNYSKDVNFNDDPWNKLAPDIFAFKLGLKSADLKPRLGGLSNWVRQLFGGQKLTPEQRFKERLIQALIKKFNEMATKKIVRIQDYEATTNYLGNALTSQAFDIKNININKLYNDLVNNFSNQDFLNEPGIIMANLKLIKSLNFSKNNPEESIKLSKAFENLNYSGGIFRGFQQYEVEQDGNIEFDPSSYDENDDLPISKFILEQLTSVPLKKALIELSKANSTKPIDSLDINNLLKQLIDNPNAKALKGRDGKLLIRFEAGQGGITESGKGAVNPTRTTIEIPHNLSGNFEYDKGSGDSPEIAEVD